MKAHKLLDETFELSVAIKGIDGLLELVGGAILLAVKPATINRLVIALTQHELVQDPHDFIANHLLFTAQHAASAKLFGAIYLLSHGLVKVVIVAALLRQKRWAYPVSICFLLIFTLYQVYRIGYNHSVGLILLTAFDVFVIWLIWREYQIKTSKSQAISFR